MRININLDFAAEAEGAEGAISVFGPKNYKKTKDIRNSEKKV